MPRKLTRSPPRGSPRVRLVSSFAMLAVVIGGVWFFSVRKTSQLFDLGVEAHARCAVNIGAAQAVVQHSALADALLSQAGDQAVLASTSTCFAAERDFTEIVLRLPTALVSVALMRREKQDVFPRLLAGRVLDKIHLSDRKGYAVAVFETGPYLAYIVSNLPDDRHEALSLRFAPVIRKLTPP